MDKKTLQNLGFSFIGIGIILLIIGIFGQTTLINCPANGCSADVLRRINAPSAISFYSGIAFIAVGIVLLVVARQMKPGTETNRKTEAIV